jgi:hypothetical protein
MGFEHGHHSIVYREDPPGYRCRRGRHRADWRRLIGIVLIGATVAGPMMADTVLASESVSGELSYGNVRDR